MTRLRIAFLALAVVAGDYAALMLIDCQIVDFGVAAAICAASSIAAGLIGYVGDGNGRRRYEPGGRGHKATTTRRRTAIGERRADRAAIGVRQQCPSCEGATENPSESAGFDDRRSGRRCRACAALNTGPGR